MAKPKLQTARVELAIATYGQADAPVTYVVGPDGWIDPVPNNESSFDPPNVPDTDQTAQGSEQRYSIFDVHYYQRADPGPRYNISTQYAFRDLFVSPSTQLIW